MSGPRLRPAARPRPAVVGRTGPVLDTRHFTRLGIEPKRSGHGDLAVPALVEAAIVRQEALLSREGALVAETGVYTGRSPQDRFIVRDDRSHDVAWGGFNQPMEEGDFLALYAKVDRYLSEREHFVFNGFAGADPAHRLAVRFVNEYAWHNLFVHQLFIRPTVDELTVHEPDFTVLAAPGFMADPDVDHTRSEAFVCLSFKHRVVVIGGTRYAGEMKKSIFGVLNYLLPEGGVLPMHCSANVGNDGDVALFFGLSGTGKTTLSTDPARSLVGDDEHGWSDTGVFNFEGGCYAKCIGLSAEREPQIAAAIRFGAVLENVVVDPLTRTLDYASGALTENTRAAYPLDYIPNARVPSMAGHPKTIIFLTADASGVLPPLLRLSEAEAMYHFLSGYTSKLAGTERGVEEPQPTFSTCFGEPFLPRAPKTYASMLGERIARHKSRVYLLNTGWTGGPYGVGQRMNLSHTRAMVRAALSGDLEGVSGRAHPVFGGFMPEVCPGVPSAVLDPRSSWADPKAYDEAAARLADAFRANFEKKFPGADTEVRAAGPRS